MPVVPPLVVAGALERDRFRVVLLGNGLAESPGTVSGASGFPHYLAQSLVGRLHCRVEVKTLIGEGWDLPTLSEQLCKEQLHWHDALIVTAAYRPQLAQIPLKRWAAYTEALRAVLVDSAGPDSQIRVLSLPWKDAARDASAQWGGLFGNRVRVVAEIAEATLTPQQRARPLRLLGPIGKKEWIGPEFSHQTYLRWANQVAADLAAAWERP